MKRIITCLYESPAGVLVIGDMEGDICLCDWAAGSKHDANIRRLSAALDAVFDPGDTATLRQASCQLDEYFAGTRRGFSLPLLHTGTMFQQRVRLGLSGIPYGSTISYAQLAATIGRPRAVRGVASAIATNPISILVPCHRVVGSNGSLTGYNAGLAVKRFLLQLEEAEPVSS